MQQHPRQLSCFLMMASCSTLLGLHNGGQGCIQKKKCLEHQHVECCKGVLLPTMSCDQHWVITAKGLPHDSGVMTSHTSKTMGNHVSVFVFGLPWTFLLEFDHVQSLTSSSIGSTVIYYLCISYIILYILTIHNIYIYIYIYYNII